MAQGIWFRHTCHDRCRSESINGTIFTALFVIGWVQAKRRGQATAHHWLMFGGMTAMLGFFVTYYLFRQLGVLAFEGKEGFGGSQALYRPCVCAYLDFSHHSRDHRTGHGDLHDCSWVSRADDRGGQPAQFGVLSGRRRPISRPLHLLSPAQIGRIFVAL